MGGFFGVASKKDCVLELFYGVDYHSHLGTLMGKTASNGQSIILRTHRSGRNSTVMWAR